MRCSIVALVASLLAASVVIAQGVTSAIAPDSSPPSGCSDTFDGTFAITVDSLSPGKQTKRQNGLTISLSNGILTDQNGRTGYIASNYQFQFDKPPQAGAIYTAGFSVCNNGSLALGDEAVWWECQSGGFYNLYDRDWATQCLPILIEVVGASLGPTESTTAAASSEQPGSTNVAVTVPSQNTNAEFIASSGTAVPVTQSSGQAVGPSTPALPATGTSGIVGSVTGGGPSATGGAGNNNTAPSQPSSNSTTILASSATITGSTSIKSSSSSASAKSSSAAGGGVPLRAQDALSGLGAALLGFALL